jgi:hypothetical protein
MWIRDPGWKKVGSEIRDKHPESATLTMKHSPGSCQHIKEYCIQQNSGSEITVLLRTIVLEKTLS